MFDHGFWYAPIMYQVYPSLLDGELNHVTSPFTCD